MIIKTPYPLFRSWPAKNRPLLLSMMTHEERKMIDAWKRDLARERQVQPLVPPATIRAAGERFRRLLQSRKQLCSK